MTPVEKIGKQLTEGALSAIGKWVIIAALCLAAWQWISPPARDATDPPSGPRSGMRLRTDNGTGCQYLETKGGALSPRLGSDGKQVCGPTGVEAFDGK
ncbi:hypothetical protein K9B33_17910 [Sphingobium sp. 3R8]|uniref:hypothetical protein n=1 Tax=Sphingobium sp. 3R8 TaxID=2874921 RepID=UPI001CCF785A|nr:hypothetical protein [Sphingobium sp. 3R8]MBZ9649414.1 hypothetical protein [Sphingobium sp. 3R8]